MKIKTTRFGEMDVDRSEVIQFKEGPLGFEHLKKFCIVDPSDQTTILWLQSMEDAAIAFPILEPQIFRPQFEIKLLPIEMAAVDIQQMSEATVFTILTIPQDITELSANLKAPIIINNKTNVARQIVLQDSKLEVKLKIYNDLKRALSTQVSDDSRRNIQSPTSMATEENAAGQETRRIPRASLVTKNKRPTLDA